MIERLSAELAARGAIGLQGRGGLAQPPDLGAQLIDHQPAIRRAASTA